MISERQAMDRVSGIRRASLKRERPVEEKEVVGVAAAVAVEVMTAPGSRRRGWKDEWRRLLDQEPTASCETLFGPGSLARSSAGAGRSGP